MAGQGEAPSIDLRPATEIGCKSRFCCGAKSVNDYLRKEAWKKHTRGQHRVTHASLADERALCGYFALATVAEEVGKLPGQYQLFGTGDHFPCLQLVWLGVDTTMQGRGIGKTLVGSVIQTFAQVGSVIGLPHLILVPIDDDVKPFYRGLNFEDYDGGKKMFLPLQTAIDAVS